MNPRNLGIVLNQGADFTVIISVIGDEGPIDLTNYSFLGEMRATTDPSSPVIVEFTFTIQNQTTNLGQVYWTIPAATIDEVLTSVATPLATQRTTTPFVYDIKMQDSVGNITRVVQGIGYVSPQATMEAFL